MGALASESGNLRASIRELAPTLENANAALASLNAAFPPTRAFAREILPGVRETPATIDAAFPWIRVASGLMSEAELQGLARDLSPATRDLAALTDSAHRACCRRPTCVSKCARDVLLPTGDVVIRDEFETGRENYKDFFYAMAGLAGEGQNFDGNGMYVRFQTGGGSQSVSLGEGDAGFPPQFGGAAHAAARQPPAPTRASVPPYVDDKPCYRQAAARPQRPGRAQDAADRRQRHGRDAPARASRASSSRSAASCGRSARGRRAR